MTKPKAEWTQTNLT